MIAVRYATYHCKVYPSNRNSDYGTPVVVIAESRQAAVDRAIALGFSGYASDARVLITSIEDMPMQRYIPNDTPENQDGLTNP